MYNVQELPYGTFSIKFTTINNYQQQDPGINPNRKAQNI